MYGDTYTYIYLNLPMLLDILKIVLLYRENYFLTQTKLLSITQANQHLIKTVFYITEWLLKTNANHIYVEMFLFVFYIFI